MGETAISPADTGKKGNRFFAASPRPATPKGAFPMISAHMDISKKASRPATPKSGLGNQGCRNSAGSSDADEQEISGGTTSRPQRKLCDGFDTIANDLKNSFHECRARKQSYGVATPFGDHRTIDVFEVTKLARELSLPICDVLLVKRVFESLDIDGSGYLELHEFEEAVIRLLQTQLHEPTIAVTRAKGIGSWCWFEEREDDNQNGGIDFKEFLKWYSSNGFNVEFLLSEHELWLRRIAKQYSIAPDYVEKIKRCFDSFDSDGSGKVDAIEFKAVMYKMLKVPPNVEMPASRIQYFWSEMDHDHSGLANFEEFLQWWLKYFDNSKMNGHSDVRPFESFYKQVRRIGKKHLDPPIYGPPNSQQGD